MRVPILLLLSIVFFVVVPANANPRDDQSAAHAKSDQVSACADLRGGTKGLYGLCVAFCAQRDQSNVNMNDIQSVRSAAPNLELLTAYNDRKTESDPDMPCMIDDDGDSDDGGEPPPPVTSCGCWSDDELLAIDGVLDPIPGMAPDAICTSNQNENGIYEAQIYEGYNLGADLELVGTSAFAYASPDGSDTAQGCMFRSPTAGDRNFPLERRAEAEYCMQAIVAQCAAIGK